MRKIFRNFTLLFLLGLMVNSYGQLAKSSWSFGFGLAYPRMINSNVNPSAANYGGFFSMQKNFSEHVGLRLKLSYLSINSTSGATDVVSNAVAGDFDLLYYLVPCEEISPYINIGVGSTYATYDNPIPATMGAQLEYEFNFGFGTEWALDEDWKIIAELGYHTTNGSTIDGATGVSNAGLLGSLEDAYMSANLGFLLLFGKGEPSRYCQIYNGLAGGDMPDPVDYEKIENIVQKYIPREIVKEVVVEKPVDRERDYKQQRWVLVGVNFDFNSTRLQTEAYPVLFHAVQVLLQNPDMKIEVQGYTDNIGTEQSNQKLSAKRAIAVKDYLLARGVSAGRVTTAGYGEANPIADNKTAQGRAMNRRIEFKVLK